MATKPENDSVSSIIKNVQFNWVHLDKAVSPFGTEQWDIRIDVPKKREAELAVYRNPKAVMKDGKPTGMVSINLKKKAILRDGGPAKKVRCVGQDKNVAIDPNIVGNGSTGNVMVIQKPYKMVGPNGKVTKEGISTMLIAIQVMSLVEYKPTGGVDFDSFDGDNEKMDAAEAADDQF